MSLLVNNPIINSPFEEPTRYWDYQDGQPIIVEKRRPAGYYFRPKTFTGAQLSILEEEFVPFLRMNPMIQQVLKKDINL